MMIYPEMRGDHYIKSWSKTEFDIQFDILSDEEAYVAVTEEGFVRLSFLEKVGQIFKSYLGGTDDTEKHRVQAAWLKFLYYGEAQGFLTDKHVEHLCYRMSYPARGVDPTIQRVFEEIRQYHHTSALDAKSEHLSRLQEMVSDYHQRHAFSLRPGFWFRLLISPTLDPNKLVFFGDTPLYLAQKALEQEEPNPSLALIYLQKAFELKNDDPEFQQKLADQLQELEESYASELKQRTIQELWIELAQTSFANGQGEQANTYLGRALNLDSSNAKSRLQIGKLYLIHQEYTLAEPFLPALQKAFNQDFQIQLEIGQAYWQKGKLQEAIEAYTTALNIHQQHRHLSFQQKQVAFIYHRIGMALLKIQAANTTSDLTKVLPFFMDAVKTDSTVPEYQESLCEAYVKQWQASANNFATLYGQEFLNYVRLFESSMIEKWSDSLAKMLINCSEKYFQAHQNQQAQKCLTTVFYLFKDKVDLKIQALDLATRYHDLAPLKAIIDEWERQNYDNPYLKEKIADAHWDTHPALALEKYQEVLDLFSQHLTTCPTDEHSVCQTHMASIQAKIGQSHLDTQPGVFKGVPYEEAIQRFEQAARLNPTEHAPVLAQAYLAAAQAEKQRTRLLRDTTKIINYYQKAFETLLQKGEYLIELMQLCLSSKRPDDAVNLYYKIRKQSWAQDLVLPATTYSDLAKQFHERKDYETALDCLKQAYKLEPQNQKYKTEYFQLCLTLMQRDYQKIQEEKGKGKLDEEAYKTRLSTLAQPLKDCLDEGFKNAEKFKQPCQEMLGKIYFSLASCHFQHCLLPQPKNEMDKEEIKQHQQQHQKDLQQALSLYNEGLSYHPENAALHFEKGLLLDWMIDYEEALKEFELAVKYQPRNPFYHKMLGLLHYAVKFDGETAEKHNELAKECASEQFSDDYVIWKDEWMCKAKTKPIDPHSYTKVKTSWF